MAASNRLTSFVGRVLVTPIFLVTGYMKATHFAATTATLASMKIPLATVATAIVILIELGGGISVLLGFKTRFCAWIMFLYLIPVTFLVHSFWKMPGAAQTDNMVHFLKNLSIMGALLLLAVYGPGPLSVDEAGGKAKT
ncbi:MAG: DoxX family protein [Candidatus Acidiferrales bacterium]